MAREYAKTDALGEIAKKRHNTLVFTLGLCLASFVVLATSLGADLSPTGFFLIGGIIPAVMAGVWVATHSKYAWTERERKKEVVRRNGSPVLGSPPDRTAFQQGIKAAKARGRVMIDRYLVGFELDSGKPIWVTDEELCGHGAVFAKTGVGKTLWLEGLMFQQMARGRASGFTFIDAKRDPGTLADIIMMALLTGRIEDLIVVDPFDPVCSYNFVFTTQRPDVKARKVLRCGLPPTSDASTTKHYDRLAADAVYRVVRAMESLGLAWSVRDIAVALSAFTVAYPRLRSLLHDSGSKQAMVELGHLASSYRTAKGSLDSARLTDNLRGIASELHSISNSEAGEMFCTPRADLSLTDAILRGKLIYYMLPRLEEAESAARMVKVFREDLEVSIGEITSSRIFKLEDPHMVIIDEGASTFGPTWANLFELARKGRFALLFGAQSVGGLMDQTMGLSEEFYERVMANVNLKVIMRLGDNRTAEDMSEWIGLIKTSKKTISTGLSSSVNARELTKKIEINRRSADGIRDGVTLADDEEELVSTEELKHEMSAEKGLAWFDKGDGILRKGRSIWFDAELPPTWEGREYLARYESVEADEVGLAEWVDEHILTIEEAESERAFNLQQSAENQPPSSSGFQGGFGAGHNGSSAPEERDEAPQHGGAFRLNILRPFRGMTRGRTTLADRQDEKPLEAPEALPTPATNSEPDNSAEELTDKPIPSSSVQNSSRQDGDKSTERKKEVAPGSKRRSDAASIESKDQRIEPTKQGHGQNRGKGGQPRAGGRQWKADLSQKAVQNNRGENSKEETAQSNSSPGENRPHDKERSDTQSGEEAKGGSKLMLHGARRDVAANVKKVG